jgi:transcriptional regulator of acetoin/glycerol metabolism
MSGKSVAKPLIDRSWVRSRMCGLDQGASPTPPYKPDFEVASRYLRAAQPVMDQLAAWLPGCGTAAVLTDASGRMLLRHTDDPELTRRLDSGLSAPGFVWSEEHAGTQAVGIALEERIAAWTIGNDHYLDALRDLACAAVPIVNPLTQRLEGVVDLTTSSHRASPLMMPMAMQAAKAIEDRLVALGTAAERRLLDCFLAATKRGARSILVIGQRAQFSSHLASSLLAADDRMLLGARAEDLELGENQVVEQIPLSSGDVVDARFEPIEHDGRRIGTLVEVVESNRLRRANSSTPIAVHGFGGSAGAGGGFVGRSTAARHVNHRIDEVGSSRYPLTIVGEPGVGKFTVAKLVAERTGKPVVFDTRNSTGGGDMNLRREVHDVLEASGSSVIIRGIEELSKDSMAHFASIAEEAEAKSCRLIATMTVASPNVSDGSMFGVMVNVPPLRERAEDILDLVPHLMRRRGSRVRIAPQVMDALMRYEWPGNVRELDNVLSAMLSRSRGSEILLSDLPLNYQRGSRRLRRIENVERSAIIQALMEADGNKTKAAELLEIGRATLYRKLRVYKLDPELMGS